MLDRYQKYIKIWFFLYFRYFLYFRKYHDIFQPCMFVSLFQLHHCKHQRSVLTKLLQYITGSSFQRCLDLWPTACTVHRIAVREKLFCQAVCLLIELNTLFGRNAKLQHLISLSDVLRRWCNAVLSTWVVCDVGGEWTGGTWAGGCQTQAELTGVRLTEAHQWSREPADRCFVMC